MSVVFFVGADYRWVIPISALLGACFLLFVDTLARVVISPAEISTGIATAIIGAPIFVLFDKSEARLMHSPKLTPIRNNAP